MLLTKTGKIVGHVRLGLADDPIICDLLVSPRELEVQVISDYDAVRPARLPPGEERPAVSDRLMSQVLRASGN